MAEEGKTVKQGPVFKGDAGDQPELTPEERMTRAFKARAEKERKEVGVIIGRCDALAKKAKRQKDITPSFSFQAKLKTAEQVQNLRTEYESLKKEALDRTHKISDSQDTGKEFRRIVEAHFQTLDSSFNLEGDFGFKPLE
jgi:hypothetical protein